MSNPNCVNIAPALQELARLRVDFAVAYRTGIEQKNLDDTLIKKSDIENKLFIMQEILGSGSIIRVKNAVNPHAEALLRAGVPIGDPITSERRNMAYDFRELLANTAIIYKEAGLVEWEQDLQNNKKILTEVLQDPVEQKKIKARIAAGMIPIVMPSRNVQMDDYIYSLVQLEPIYRKAGIKQLSMYGAIKREEYKQPTSKENFFHGIPERPYLLWVVPSLTPITETCNLSVEAQKALYKTMCEDHPELYDSVDLIPTEYAALQAVFTRLIDRMSGKTNFNVIPLDFRKGTRFIVNGFFDKRGDITGVVFSDGGLSFSFLVTNARDDAGFRPASRT